MKPVLLKSASDSHPPAGHENGDLDGFLPESFAPPPTAAPARRNRAGVAVVALVCLLAAGAITGLWLRASSIAATPITGSLRVESDPLGADVLIDGSAKGKTPLTLALAVGQHQLVVQQGGKTQQLAVTIERETATVHHISWPADLDGDRRGITVGSLRVVTDPASAARVSVDGVDRGATPLTLTDLTPGEHDVVVRNQGGSHRRAVTIERGAMASLVISNDAEGVSSGWLSATTDAPLQIFEGGKLIGSTESDRIMLPVGDHSFEFANDSLGFRATRAVKIVAGQTATVAMQLPRAPMSVNAVPWAQVWIDGQPFGETPLGNVMQTIGSHQLIFRHPELGERRVTAVVTLNQTARVAIDMRKQ
jgi:PEGA domain-containing protein